MAFEQDPTHPTGVAVVGDKDDNRVARARERKALAALALKVGSADQEPLTYEEIAEVLGYPDARRAQVAVEQALEAELREDPKNRGRMRDLVNRRMEQLLRSVWKKANDPDHEQHLPANARAQAILESIVKMYGLNAPQEVNIHTPTNNELQEWVGKVYNATQHIAEEGDIFDAEIVEDEPAEIEA